MSRIKVEVVSRNAPRPRKRRPDPEKRAAVLQGRRTTGARLAAALRWLIKPRVVTWGASALVFVTVAYGTPHLLVTYRCIEGGRCFECRYFGVQGMRAQLGPNWDCPVVTMLPVNWAPLIARVTGG